MFTQQLTNVYAYAKKYARSHSTYVHTGHFLDGLLSIDNPVKTYLNEFGIKRSIFKEENYGASASQNEAEAITLKASAISNQLKSPDCDCVHLMLAIFSVPDCYARKYLQFNMPENKRIVDLEKHITAKIPDYDKLMAQVPKKVSVFERPASFYNPSDFRSQEKPEASFQPKPEASEVAKPFLAETKPEINIERQEEAVAVAESSASAELAYCTDITEKARQGKFDPVIGREEEIQRIVQSLTRRTKNNPVLIGEAGVGKSAIVEGLAQAIVNGNVPNELSNKKILELDIGGMVAGSRFRGDFEERFKTILAALTKSSDSILFIDEIHNLVGAGASVEKGMDAAEMLKPMLARGAIRTIGATTVSEYRKYIEKDPALERRFQPILVNQPTPEQAVMILKGVKSKYEQHHGVVISNEAVEAAVELAVRYLPDRSLPDKAFDVLDEACSMAKLKEFKGALSVRQTLVINFEHIASVVSLWTGIPLKQLCQTEKEKLLNLESAIEKRVVGQSQAIKSVANAIRRARTGLKDPNRPIGSFIFVGPTGVGKTELCKALAESMFGSSEEIIRLDMSEYMEKQSSSKLIGAPPGYIGYDEGGQLTEKVRLKPYSVVLFDEIEKAHPEVFNLMLQILDEGRITDSHGKHVDFKNTIIIMTSNLGVEPGVLSLQNYLHLKENIIASLKKHFRPEFLNRVDDTVVFQPLSPENIEQITKLLCLNLARRLKGTISLNFTPNAIAFLSEAGFDLEYGARPLKRAIQKGVEDILADKLLKGEILRGDKVTVAVRNNDIEFLIE